MVENPCFVLDEPSPPPLPRPVSKQKRRCECNLCGYCKLLCKCATMNRGLLSDTVYRDTTESLSRAPGAARRGLQWGARRGLQPLIRRATSLFDITTFQESSRVFWKPDQTGGLAQIEELPQSSYENQPGGSALDHISTTQMLRQKCSEEEEGEGEHEHLVLGFQRWPGRRRLRPSHCHELRVLTSFGDIVVIVTGSPDLPAMITYHDLGLNYAVLVEFFNQRSMRVIANKFCIHHVCAPGQEKDATDLPDSYTYPSMDELAKQVDEVCKYMNIDHFVGFGVGLGANVMLRYAIRYPKKVDGLVVVNATTSAISWRDWALQKIVNHSLSVNGLTPVVMEYLLRHIFGYRLEERCPGTAAFYREYIHRHMNPNNLARLMYSWSKRSALSISRSTVTLGAPVLNATGDLSLYVEDTVALNTRLSPKHATWIKFQDAGSVINECPDKLAEAFRLFVQGESLATISSTDPLLPSILAKLNTSGYSVDHSDE